MQYFPLVGLCVYDVGLGRVLVPLFDVFFKVVGNLHVAQQEDVEAARNAKNEFFLYFRTMAGVGGLESTNYFISIRNAFIPVSRRNSVCKRRE